MRDLLNIEFKARVPEFRALVRRLRACGARRVGALRQVDAYYRCASGRLKLRVINGQESVLIAYHRPALRAPRTSAYSLLPLTQQQASDLASMLSCTLGLLTTIRKTRVLWLFERTRIHLDTVASLGRFVELETVVQDASTARARREHRRLLTTLGLEDAPPIAGSYSDLMLNDGTDN